MGSPGPGRRRWSLRVLIPALILVCGLAIVALQFAITYRVASDRVRQEMRADLDFVGT